jgi:CheY-like chemotaxis protein
MNLGRRAARPDREPAEGECSESKTTGSGYWSSWPLTDMNLVAQASNGREAIQQFREHRRDITLMDLQMPANERPGSDGRDLHRIS